MLMEWLEPAIEKRIDEVTEVCDNNLVINGLYDKIIEVLEELKRNMPDQFYPQINDIEKTINARARKIIEVSYRLGFMDGLDIKTDE
jgi:protoheme ferro-lyase